MKWSKRKNFENSRRQDLKMNKGNKINMLIQIIKNKEEIHHFFRFFQVEKNNFIHAYFLILHSNKMKKKIFKQTLL